MCPQPAPDSLINPCLTFAAFSAYLTGLTTIFINSFLIYAILRHRPKTPSHYFLSLNIALNSLVISFASITGVLSGNPRLFTAAIYAFYPIGLFMLASFYWFVHSFLKIKERGMFFFSLVYALGGSLVLALNPHLILTGTHWNPLLGYYEWEFHPQVVFTSFLGFFFWIWGGFKLFQAYQSSHSLIERNRLKYLLFAPLIYFVGMVLIIIPATHIFPFDMVAATISSLLLTYAILRHHLLDITVVIRKSLIYSFLTAVITSFYLFFSLFLQLLLHRSGQLVSFPAGLSTAIFVVLIFQPLQTNTQAFIDRLFFRRRYDPQKLVAHLSQTFAITLDLNLLSEKLLTQLRETLQIKNATLFLSYEETGNLRLQKAQPLPSSAVPSFFSLPLPFLQLLSQKDQVLLKSDLQEKNLPLNDLEQFQFEAFVPLRSQGRLRGLLCLGPKLSQELYSLEELSLLETIARAATLALDKAALFHQLTQEKDKVESARAKLEEKVAELERFYKLAVGRELRMVELKKEINQLKGKT